MRNTRLFLLLLLCAFFSVNAQDEITSKLYDTYDDFKEVSLNSRRIKYNELQLIIDNFRNDNVFTIKKVGESIQGRNLNLISIGTGDVDVFLWSQMHGNEPTATQAIFDILNFLKSSQFQNEKAEILSKLRLHFLPMLNPDGAEIFQRRNILGIDINRDALRLQSPEGRTLKRVRDSLQAEFGFNLHDQSTYYNANLTDKPASISYLAPAYNYEKDINEVRANAMKVIAFMNKIIQKYAPGQVGKYNDDFEPRAFGDNIQKWGTSAILIESGGYKNDVEKQEIRKLNYVSILAAIYTIAKEGYKNIPLSDYNIIPENDRKLFDLKIEKATYNLLGENYVIDIGINCLEVETENNKDFWYSSRIKDQGDLSTYFGYETILAEGFVIKSAKVYPEVITSLEALKAKDINTLLKQGYGYIRVDKIPRKMLNSPFPIHIIGKKYKVPSLFLEPGINPTFFLEEQGKLRYAIINGFAIDLKAKSSNFINAMIFR